MHGWHLCRWVPPHGMLAHSCAQAELLGWDMVESMLTFPGLMAPLTTAAA